MTLLGTILIAIGAIIVYRAPRFSWFAYQKKRILWRKVWYGPVIFVIGVVVLIAGLVK